MTLPDICPLDNSTECKGLDCHLFCVEWRTKEPICLIGYGTTSRKRVSKTDQQMDTYAEETFNKLGKKTVPKSKACSEKGDWTPKRMAEALPKKPVERIEGTGLIQDPLRAWPQSSVRKPKESLRDPKEPQRKSLNGKRSSSEAEAKEKITISAKLQPQENQEKPKIQEKIILRDKHATIFASCDENETDTVNLPRRAEKPKKSAMSEEKRKKLDDLMELDLPDNYEEEFWS